MNHRHRAELHPGSQDRVLVVGAGPVGCTAALLLAGFGIPVTLLERHAEPHSLPRAVHLDDEVARTLGRIGIGAEFPGPVPARQRAAPARRPAPRDSRAEKHYRAAARDRREAYRVRLPGAGPENRWRCAR